MGSLFVDRAFHEADQIGKAAVQLSDCVGVKLTKRLRKNPSVRSWSRCKQSQCFLCHIQHHRTPIGDRFFGNQQPFLDQTADKVAGRGLMDIQRHRKVCDTHARLFCHHGQGPYLCATVTGQPLNLCKMCPYRAEHHPKLPQYIACIGLMSGLAT